MHTGTEIGQSTNGRQQWIWRIGQNATNNVVKIQQWRHVVKNRDRSCDRQPRPVLRFSQSVINIPFQFFFLYYHKWALEFRFTNVDQIVAVFFHSKHASSTGYVCIANESEFSDHEDSCTGWFVYLWVTVPFTLIKVVLILFWYAGYKSTGIYVIQLETIVANHS